MTAATVSVHRRDRPWLHSHPALVVGPFDTPSVDEIRTAVARLVDAYPHSRLNWRIDGRRWVADRSPETIVVEDDADPAWDIAEMLDATWRRYADRGPLTFVRYPNHIGMVLSHALGDGSVFLEMMGAVAHTAFTGELATWSAQPSGSLPLATAGLRTFGRHPAMIRKAVADKVSPDEPTVSGAVVPWRPSRRTVGVVFPKTISDEMVDWGKRFTPSPSRFALLTCALLRAMSEAGIAVSRDVHMLVDLRKYLGGDPINGNFIADVPMRIGTHTPPQDVAAVIRTTLSSGRPLANAILTSMRAGGRRRRAATDPDSYDPGGLPTVTVSAVSASGYVNRLPFFDDQPAIYAACGLPAGPHGVTFGVGHTHRTTALTANFHDNVMDATRMQSVLDMVAADPLRLLDVPRLAL
jgi:hypothetical protein